MQLSVGISEEMEVEVVLKSLKETVRFLDNLEDEHRRWFIPDWERILNSAKCIIEYYEAPPNES